MDIKIKLFYSSKLSWLQHSVFENCGYVIGSLQPGKTEVRNSRAKNETILIYYMQGIPENEAKGVVDELIDIIKRNQDKLTIYNAPEVLSSLQTIVANAIYSKKLISV